MGEYVLSNSHGQKAHETRRVTYLRDEFLPVRIIDSRSRVRRRNTRAHRIPRRMRPFAISRIICHSSPKDEYFRDAYIYIVTWLFYFFLCLPARTSRFAIFSHRCVYILQECLARIKIVSFGGASCFGRLWNFRFPSTPGLLYLLWNWRVSSLSTMPDAEWYPAFEVEGVFEVRTSSSCAYVKRHFFSFSFFRFLGLLSHSTENREATRGEEISMC